MRTIEAKVVVLGAQGVGKTSLVVRYIGKMFNNHISPTIGASFFTCKINVEDTRVKLQVWDTAGQERFRSMAPMYYRNANAALLVFDITSHESFEAVIGWVKELQRNVEEPLVLNLVGNKTDLAGERQVSKDEAIQYALNIGGSYFESSALQDHDTMAGKTFSAAQRRPARPLAALLRAAAVLCVALLLVAASAPAAASYRKPPFNGSIFGKRASAAAAAPTTSQEYEAAAAGKALSALCEVAAEACSAWFPQQNELN